MQDVFLFSDTIEENILFGVKEGRSQDTMVQKSMSAQAHDFIDRMEDNYKTVIGEKGIGLSGGQKQRISIARALAKKANILIFDDSTSALDMETEYRIQHEIEKLDNMTKIIIAHRISAVKKADEIIILEKGEIVERGNHKELIALKGRYYQTYIEQYEGFMAG
jgi:ATP-binding cassette subfamily B protein